MRAGIAAWAALVATSAGWVASEVVLGQKPELVVETGHTDVINSVAFSPDGRMLVSGSDDTTIKLWDVSSGRELRTLASHSGAVNSVAFSPDGRSVASGSSDGTIKLWEVSSGREQRTLVGQSHAINSVAFSPDGSILASGSANGTIKLWEVASGSEQRTLSGDAGLVKSIAFSPGGRTLASGGKFGTIKLWDVSSGHELSKGQMGLAPAIALSKDGRMLGYEGLYDKDHRVKLWDMASGHELRTMAGDAGEVSSLGFSPDGSILASGSLKDRVYRITLWDVESGRELRTVDDNVGWVSAFAFSPDGLMLASGSSHQIVENEPSDSHVYPIELWDVASGRKLRTLASHTSRVMAVALSPNGRTLASANMDHTVKLWDMAGGRELRVLAGHEAEIHSVAFSRDGRTLASASFDDTIKLWDVNGGRALPTLVTHTDTVNSIAFSPDGRRLVSICSVRPIKFWDVASGRPLGTLLSNSDGFSVAFSPDGRIVASGNANNTITLWDAASGRELRSFIGRVDAISLAFSPDGRLMASGGLDATIKLWDVASGHALRTLAGHTKTVDAVAFSPDGRTLASASIDRTIKLWDVASRRELRTLTGHTGGVASVAFSTDGRLVLSGSEDGSVRIWDSATGDQLAAVYPFAGNDWAVVDSQGRFDTSDLDGGAPLHWILADDPMHALPLEIFMRDYYTPRLLSRIMNDEKLPAVRSIAEIKNRVQPKVEIVSVSLSKTQPGRADVVVHAASVVEERKDAKGELVKEEKTGKVETQASGLQDLRLFRDGQLVANTKLDDPLADGDFKFTDIQLPTAAKSVTFTAYAFNSERIKSATVQKKYEYEPGTARKPRAFLVQVGVNHYEAAGCELHGSVNDAEALSRVLAEKLRGRGLNVQEPVLLVSDGRRNGATKDGIKAALEKIAAEATPDDVFFLSFSGHGYGDKNGQFYIFPSDIRGSCRDVNETLLAKAISADDLADWLRPIDAGEMTFVLDSCQSASSVEANGFKPGPMGSRGLGQLAYDKRIRILAASQGNQEAKETNLLAGAGAEASGEKIRGLLSYALTDEGLLAGKADWKPVDGKITVGEWLTYAADAVPKGLMAGKGRGFDDVVEAGTVDAAQTPAVFDFSKKDGFVLEEVGK